MTPEQDHQIFRSIFREANDAFFVVEPKSLKFLDANPAAQRLTGLKRKQLLVLKLPELFKGRLESDLEKLILACQATDAFVATDGYQVKSSSGDPRPVHITVSRIHVPDGPWGLLVVRDMTRQMQAEEDRVALERRMLEAQKLESLGILAGGIAHDFNNILTSVLGFADLALLDVSPESRARGYMEQVVIAARRAADLTSQMLVYSGKSPFAVQPLDLRDLIKELFRLLQVSVAKKCTLKVELPRQLPAIMADPAQIRQVTMNLILNAAEAVQEDCGEVTVRASEYECTGSEAWGAHQPNPVPPGAYVCLEVSDNGAGMDNETITRLFDPFFSTKKAGRGLGLAAVLGIVRGHEGAIRVKSEQGRGTTMQLFFPTTDKPAETTRLTPGQVESSLGGTAIVIDDEAPVRGLAQEMLEWLGFDVITACDGIEGLQKIESHADPIRLILLDFTMPKLDGAATLRQLKQLRPEVPVIVSSGYGECLAAERTALAESAGFLPKPYRLMDLTRTLRSVLGEAAFDG